ncbi:MAG: glycosyltransferase, partial [Hyphomicrobiales bacterium]|nr:glycosyltransferase [Hyphomicrobiales bacterium]
MTAHVLCVGGEDHGLRIPFLLALRERGFHVSAAGSGDAGPFAQVGLPYFPFRFERFVNPFADWRAIGTLSRLLSELRPELVQSFDTKPNLLVPLAARKARSVRVVRTINGLGWIYSSRSLKALALSPVYRGLHKLASRSTTATLFQNRDDMRFFERYRLLGKSAKGLIPGSGIDVEKFERARRAGPSRAELRQVLGLGTREVVLTVTRLTRQKGIPTLLEAAALVHQARPGVHFLLVGPRQSEGPLAISQAEIDRHSAYVTALGPRSDIPALLGVADAFAFPTEYREGVPRALLEAALAGLPIVTTRMPGCSDVIEDGWSGFLVPPRSPRELAQRIIDLLRERQEAAAMSSRAAQWVRQEFGLKLTVKRYAEVYED